MFKKGYKMSEETKEKIRLSKIGKKRPPRTKEWCRKISDGNKGKHLSEEHKKILIAGARKPKTEETKRKMSLAKKGKRKPEEWVNTFRKGEKHPNWRGGVSFEPYCPKFNREFKERVRNFFGRACVECGTPERGKKLHVHHVNFNKMSCCDGTEPLFVPLCVSCHSKTQKDRDYWEEHFTNMIETYYEGRCWL